MAGLLLWLEHRRPLRAPTQSKWERLVTNALVSGVAAGVIRLALLPAALAFAGFLQKENWGLLNWARWPAYLHGGLALLWLDYTLYLWHRLNHKVPFLWRFHLVHHTDLDLDVLTASRFHFGELLLSIPYRLAQLLVIGASPLEEAVFETVVLIQTQFHHSNVRLPRGVERRLNWILVTPRMHGIHHSVVEEETNSNWSIIFSWWDRWHHTWRWNIPQASLIIGVPAYRDPKALGFRSLMAMPFKRQRPTWLLPDAGKPPRGYII